MAERYRFGTTNIEDFLTHLQIIDGNIGIPPLLQNDYVVPGRTGVVAATPWWGPRVITFGGVVSGASRAEYQDRLKSLANLVHNGGLTYRIRRALDLPTTPSTEQLVEARCRYVGGLERVQQVSNRAARVAFDIQLMDGYWYDIDYSNFGTVTGDRTRVVLGDAPTQDIVLTYSASPATQRIRNAAFPGIGRLTLVPGSNRLIVSGGGNVKVEYKAAWL